jgi:hypothetical protein
MGPTMNAAPTMNARAGTGESQLSTTRGLPRVWVRLVARVALTGEGKRKAGIAKSMVKSSIDVTTGSILRLIKRSGSRS